MGWEKGLELQYVYGERPLREILRGRYETEDQLLAETKGRLLWMSQCPIFISDSWLSFSHFAISSSPAWIS
jgi:hypothetical protein